MKEAARKRHRIHFALEILDLIWEIAKRSLVVGAIFFVAKERQSEVLEAVGTLFNLLLWMWASFATGRVFFPSVFAPEGDPDTPRSDGKQFLIGAVIMAGAGVAFFITQSYVGLW